MTDNSLIHFGTKGMKWGVRKDRGHEGQRTKSKKIKLSDMSDDELRRVNKRAQLEQEYRRRNPNRKERGKAAAKALMGTAMTGITLYNMVNSPAGKAAIDIGKKAVGTALAGAAINFDGMKL